MKTIVSHAVVRIMKKVSLAFVAFAMLAGISFADVLQDVNRLFELHAKLKPGTTMEMLNEMLGPPAENHTLGGNASAVTRYAWLHGEMGIEAYEVEGVAYRVAITLPCGSNLNQLRAMDALTRQGRSKYGSLPLADPRRNEFYWERNGIRFAFSKHSQTAIMSSTTRVR